jgi:hypothetical protein
MGYIKLSKFMVTKNYPVFRQFQEAVSVASELKMSSLSNAEPGAYQAARDLLYLQAELVHLESEYQRVAKADRELGDDDERHLYAFEWWHLSQSEARGFEGEQWALALRIRTKLREYCELSSHLVPTF